MRYNREEMAEALAVARPSLSRALTQMKEEGIIDYDRKVFRILDPTALEVMT
ncbi:MAG: helix-turn-helix domain-containing protein [Peptococcus niger]